MEPFVSKTRVDYSETDQMGIVHHSNYLKYYETARWDLFRYLGIPYKELEELGLLLPVINMHIHFLKPAFYDEELTVETLIKSFIGAKLRLSYKLFNNKQLINEAEITVAFVDRHSRKACKPPLFVVTALENYFYDVQHACI